MSEKPLIGITLDAQDSGGYSQYPWYALRQNYCLSITKAGGIPFPLIHDLSLVDDYLSLIDGLMITGGGHDIHPHLYGDQELHPAVTLNLQRTAFELEITKAALQKNLPVFGICGGHQVLNVALGGTLIQHIPDEVPECLEHQQQTPRHQASHTVTISKETFLHRVMGKEELSVNSIHHQAIKKVGADLIVNAMASDGIIEGIESPTYRFCVGLQWHPEFEITPEETTLFETFIETARG